MALVKCAECGNDVSTFASSCPHCGMPMAPVGNDQEDLAVKKRICCPDGTCSGIIGENGMCRKCGANPKTFQAEVPSSRLPTGDKGAKKTPHPLFLFIFAFVVVVTANYYFGKNDLRTADTKKTVSPAISNIPESKPISDVKKLSDEEIQAAAIMAALGSKGYVSYTSQSSFVFLNTEPKLLNSMMHQEKEQFCRQAGIFFRALAKERGEKPNLTLIIFDMTSKEKLAYADVYTERIDTSIER